MTFATLSHVNLHYVLNTEKVSTPQIIHTFPRRRHCIFIHGLFFGNLAGWFPAISHPIYHLANTLCYDLRGHGLSECPREGYELSNHMNDLDELIREVGWQEEELTLIGHSFGGRIAIEFTLKYPECVKQLILLDCPLGYEDVNLPVSTARTSEELWLVLPQSIRERLDQQGRRAQRMLQRWSRLLFETSFIEDHQSLGVISQEHLDIISQKLWALYGSQSGCKESYHTLQRVLSAERLMLLEGAGHFLLTEQPDQVLTFLINALNTDQSALDH